MLALACVVILGGAAGCVRQQSQAARSDSRANTEERSAANPGRCVDAERETRVLDLAASSGQLAPQKIRDVMQREQASLSECFDASLERQPAFKGSVTLLFAIEPDGSVSQTSVVQSDLADCAVIQCLRAQLERLSFPAPEGGAVMVQYPIRGASQPLPASVTASRR
jgi:hypothetical protein